MSKQKMNFFCFIYKTNIISYNFMPFLTLSKQQFYEKKYKGSGFFFFLLQHTVSEIPCLSHSNRVPENVCKFILEKAKKKKKTYQGNVSDVSSKTSNVQGRNHTHQTVRHFTILSHKNSHATKCNTARITFMVFINIVVRFKIKCVCKCLCFSCNICLW